jgi:hypothetical protein
LRREETARTLQASRPPQLNPEPTHWSILRNSARPIRAAARSIHPYARRGAGWRQGLAVLKQWLSSTFAPQAQQCPSRLPGRFSRWSFGFASQTTSRVTAIHPFDDHRGYVAAAVRRYRRYGHLRTWMPDASVFVTSAQASGAETHSLISPLEIYRRFYESQTMRDRAGSIFLCLLAIVNSPVRLVRLARVRLVRLARVRLGSASPVVSWHLRVMADFDRQGHWRQG